MMMQVKMIVVFLFFFSSRRRHTRWNCDWSSDVCSSDLGVPDSEEVCAGVERGAPRHGDLHRRLREAARGPLLTAGLRSHEEPGIVDPHGPDRKSTRLNSSHSSISYAVFCLEKKNSHKIP